MIGTKYYDHIWDKGPHHIAVDDAQRIHAIMANIPSGCTSILDIGCGDGRVTNYLYAICPKVVGLDISSKALKHVKGETLCASADYLPYTDRSFDLVLCSETLEHLPFLVYPRAIAEINRVARKYILVTVPYSENRRAASIQCPYCGCYFHLSWHVRSFKEQDLSNLFRDFTLTFMQRIGEVEDYPYAISQTLRCLKLLPQPVFPPSALCPQCSYTTEDRQISGIVKLSRPVSLAKRILPRLATWAFLSGLYTRTEV